MSHPNPKRKAIPSIALSAFMLVSVGCRSWCPGQLAAFGTHPPSCDAIAVNAGYSETNWTSLASDCSWDLPAGYETHETIEYEPGSLPIGELRQIDFEDALTTDDVTDNQRDSRDDRVKAAAVAEALALAMAEAIVEVDTRRHDASDELDALNRPGGPEYVEVEVESLR